MDEPPILLYDDRCGVCHWFVQWVLRNDSGGRFMFAPLTSRTGQLLLARHRVGADVDSVVVIHQEQAFVKSSAVLEVFREIGGVWRILRVSALVPRAWRDACYDAFARRRSRLAARLRLGCDLPTLRTRRRFLD